MEDKDQNVKEDKDDKDENVMEDKDEDPHCTSNQPSRAVQQSIKNGAEGKSDVY